MTGVDWFEVGFKTFVIFAASIMLISMTSVAISMYGVLGGVGLWMLLLGSVGLSYSLEADIIRIG